MEANDKIAQEDFTRFMVRQCVKQYNHSHATDFLVSDLFNIKFDIKTNDFIVEPKVINKATETILDNLKAVINHIQSDHASQ